MINPNDISSLSTDEDKKEQPAVGGLSTPMVFKAPTSGKGLGQVSFPAGTLVDEQTSKGMLANMEKLLERKPFEDFQTDLQKMYAWTKYDKEPMFRQLAEQEQIKDSQRYNIAQSITAMQAGQNQTKTLAESLGIPMGGQPAMGGQPGMGGQPAAGGRKPPYIEMLESLPPHLQGWGMTLLKSNQLGEFGKLVKENEFKRPELQKNLAYADTQPADRGDLIKRSILEKGYSPQSYIGADGKTYQFTAPGAMPAQAAAPSTAGITDAQDWARKNNIPLSPNGGNRTFDQQMAQFIENPQLAAAPGTSPHEQKRALDIPAKDRTPEVRAKLLAAGFKENAKEPWHFELPKSGTAGAVATLSAPVSKEDVDLAQKEKTQNIESFYGKEGVNADVVKRGLAADNRLKLSDQALNNIKGDKYGPGTELGQSFAKFAQLAGVKLNDKELDTYIRNLNIENARKFLSAESARAAMGAQFTAPEAEAWLKAFAGIDNPKEYLKNFYQIEKAGALVDKDLHMYLLRSKKPAKEAYIEWQDSGAKDRIMRENVDAFKNVKLGETSAPAKETAAKIPAGIPENAKQAADGKYYAPDPNRKGKYLMFEAKAQ